MEKIKIGFSRPKTWKPLSALIMSAYGTPFSHTFIKIWSEKYQRYLIYQASSTMVNFCNETTFSDQNEVVFEFECQASEDLRTRVMQFAIDHAGIKYSVKQLVGFSYVRVSEWLGAVVKNPVRDGKNSFVCSELVASILVECFEYDLPKSPDDMTPKDIYDFLKVKLLNL